MTNQTQDEKKSNKKRLIILMLLLLLLGGGIGYGYSLYDPEPEPTPEPKPVVVDNPRVTQTFCVADFQDLKAKCIDSTGHGEFCLNGYYDYQNDMFYCTMIIGQEHEIGYTFMTQNEFKSISIPDELINKTVIFKIRNPKFVNDKYYYSLQPCEAFIDGDITNNSFEVKIANKGDKPFEEILATEGFDTQKFKILEIN